jgi:hypothetical protein
MRPNTADTRCVEISTRDDGGTARERRTCFGLFVEMILGRTRGWSVICGCDHLEKWTRVKKYEEHTNRERAEIGLDHGVFEGF